MKYLSLFSGIEAASIAWEPLGWQPMAFAEVEAFPSAVLAHHWPTVPNLGDVTAVDWREWRQQNGRPDVMVAGSPCQAFSQAGARGGLDDARGNLALFTAKLVEYLNPRLFIWENVPGVFSLADNAFGHLLGELLGGDGPVGRAKSWRSAGLASGPKGRLAWRILDAQYFGLAQRRTRVILAFSPADGPDPLAVLSQPAGVQRDSAPSREEGAIASALTANGVGTCGADDNQAQANHLIPDISGPLGAHHCHRYDLDTAGAYVPDICEAVTAKWSKGSGGPSGDETQNLVVPSWWDGGQVSETLDCSKLLKQQTMPEKGRFAAVLVPEVADPISASEGKTYTHEGAHNFRMHNTVIEELGVRRLTPMEAERLQGFPDDHTRIPIQHLASKPRSKHFERYPDHYDRNDDGSWTRHAADGPRYKAIGNSMATNVMAWLGQRIQEAM